MTMFSMMLLGAGTFTVLALLILALAAPSARTAGSRRLTSLRDRHAGVIGATAVEAQIRRISNRSGGSNMDKAAARLLLNPAQLAKRLEMTGKSWTVGQYGMATLGLVVVIAGLLLFRGAPLLVALIGGLVIGGFVPHLVVGFHINRRINRFTAKFPDAIELLVRGLRSGLAITETIGVVGTEINGPVGEEFRTIADKMKIGRTLDQALQETADRLGTAEFQFFTITIAIQRETGGNLTETLSNLAEVLRKRAQMKLKIKAMSSESKASAYIIGSLPFIVFCMIWVINGTYMQNFFIDPRLIIAGIGGMIWMGLGAFIMAKMINFEI